MNIKPFYQQVITAISESQDGGKLDPRDVYSQFLRQLIVNNTVANVVEIDAGEVDTEELASNLRYSIDQFQRALKAVEKFNH